MIVKTRKIVPIVPMAVVLEDEEPAVAPVSTTVTIWWMIKASTPKIANPTRQIFIINQYSFLVGLWEILKIRLLLR